MKTFIAAIFLISFTAFTFSNAVIYVYFFANQKSIAENFCVNKAKPAMNCHGKCQLAKKIKSEESKDTQNSNRKNENRNEVISFDANTASIDFVCVSCTIRLYPCISSRLQSGNSSGIFRPPSFC